MPKLPYSHEPAVARRVARERLGLDLCPSSTSFSFSILR
jgi:hypothetical protein